MKYVYLITMALILGFIEGTVGIVGLFVYVNFLFISAVLYYWLVNGKDTLAIIIPGGLIVDLLAGQWIGVTLLAFFAGLISVQFIGTVISFDSREKRLFASVLHLALTLTFNYLLVLLIDNSLGLFQTRLLLTMIVVSALIYIFAWILASTQIVKSSSFYG